LVDEAFKELRERQDLHGEFRRVSKIAERWGY